MFEEVERLFTQREREILAMEQAAGISREDFDAIARPELEEIDRRRELYLKGRQRPELKGRTALRRREFAAWQGAKRERAGARD